MSDNGGIDRETVTSNAPLRDGKASKYEGGIRVPLMVRWPGKTTAGSLCDVPVDCNDIFPTILSAAGQGTDLAALKLDGESLLPLFGDIENRASGYSRESFFWHAPFGGLDKKGNYKPSHSAVRYGDWKLLFDHQGYFELYNLSNDISEAKNLAASMPEKTEELFNLLNDWMNETIHPKYQPRANPLYDPAANAKSAAPPYRNLRKLSVKAVSKPVAKKAASPVKTAPVAKPGVKRELRRWAVGKHQENTGSYVRTFINPKQKKLVVLRAADGKEFNISHRVLTPEDLAYLESIQAETKQ
jgi:hypothetical protein